MKKPRQNNCDDVVELLVNNFWSKSKSELEQKIANIAQDFISRKLFNSTVRINKQLHTEYEFVQKLIEQIIESLKQDFSHIPLATCKDKLLSIVEIEYKKLIPRTTSRLVKANLGQKGILEQYKKGILGEMEKAKEKIEIKCAISEKENAAARATGEKWYQNRTIQAALIGAGVLLLVSIVSWLISFYVNESGGDSSSSTIPSGPNTPFVDYNDPRSKQLQAEAPAIIKKGEKSIEPEEREADVNRPQLSPITKIPERAIAPEETSGEVNEPKRPEIIKRKERPIEPEEK